MKNILLTAFFLLLFFPIRAQQIAVSTEPATRIPVSALNYENQKLRSDLTLTDSQFTAIKEITLERFKARQVVEEMFKYEPKKKIARTREIERQFDAEFAEVLTSNQYKKYLKLQGRDKEEEGTETAGSLEPEAPNFNAQIQDLIKKATTPVLDSSLIPKQYHTEDEFAINTDSLMEILPAGLHAEQALSADSGQKIAVLTPQTQPDYPEKPNHKDPAAGITPDLNRAGAELSSENQETGLFISETEESPTESLTETDPLKDPAINIIVPEGPEMMAP